MSKRFAIRSTRPEEQKQAGHIIFGTGYDVPFKHSCVVHAKQIGIDNQKQPIFEHQTGLEPKHIKNNTLLEDIEVEAFVKLQKEDLKKLQEHFGADSLKPTNNFFWNEKSGFIVSNETLTTFFDKENPEHLLLYWKIIGGGYSDAIGLSYNVANQLGLPFYLTELEEEAERKTEEIGFKGKAFASLEEINERKSAEDMLWLCWILLDANKGYTKQTAKASLYASLYAFIDGVGVKKGKKQTAKQFLDAYNLLKVDKTKALIKAFVKAGEYFALIYSNKDNQLQIRSTGTILGNTLDEAMETLAKPVHQEELEDLRREVEIKLLK